MKRVMVGLMAGVVVVLMLTSPLAAYDRDVTLPTPNQSNPVWMYESDTGDDISWDDPITSSGIVLDDGFWWLSIKHGFGVRFIWHHFINSVIKHPRSNTQIGNIGTIDNENTSAADKNLAPSRSGGTL